MIDLMPYWMWALMLVIGVLVACYTGADGARDGQADRERWSTRRGARDLRRQSGRIL
ncbi:hypothetical protein [Chitinasiproducens palmae]|uniref:Uncharacterized protein n=1 Tax=Chitinasiproducens palmae TaxID=1770053 RepID=A0A1H2PM69_9BURK|nr:hypothetical protein [Chitinasiproducens palmae]SDV47638.1 hypothetical protein SAMN05216551_103176 [Chitinasiproducens palmae]